MPTSRFATLTTATILALWLPSVGYAEDAAVDVADNEFVPESVSIDVGDTVTWTTTGNNPHTITAEDGSYDQTVSNGDTFEWTFDEAGTYRYYCRFHGGTGGVGMSGTITVGAGQASPTPTETESETETTVSGSITVRDQSGNGTSVTVDSVTINGNDGFVVVHADQSGGPGAVLGHAAVSEGTTAALRVPMDTALTSDQTVWPMLHVDAGTKGTYEFPGPDGPVMSDGQVVVKSLAFTLEAASGDLPATGGSWWALMAAAVLALGLGLTATRYRRT